MKMVVGKNFEKYLAPATALLAVKPPDDLFWILWIRLTNLAQPDVFCFQGA